MNLNEEQKKVEELNNKISELKHRCDEYQDVIKRMEERDQNLLEEIAKLEKVINQRDEESKAKKLCDTFATNDPVDDSGEEEGREEDIDDPQTGPSSDSPPRMQPFIASKGWFFKFQKRYGLKSVSVHGEAASADTAAAENCVKNDFKKIIAKGECLLSMFQHG
ncbi:hypothetical protein SK128_002894 [Halocaridina rubra]|uniref:HTH CENPB-type domain-containing protein n=1 Tax=Halocaridina rubra TaxID=373956 RepID=A0AAN9AC12_HALRR